MLKSKKTNAISLYVLFIMRCTIAEQRVKNKVSDASRMKKSSAVRNNPAFISNCNVFQVTPLEGGNDKFNKICYL